MICSEPNQSLDTAPRVDLVLAETGSVPWQLGATLPVTFALDTLCHKEETLRTTSAGALLFWDPALGQPDQVQVLKALRSPSDLWHAGLGLGMRGLPGLVDFVHPTWMFNRDPSPDIEATSWRVSLRACLVRTDVLRKMGFLHSEFSAVEGAALEWGHRLITRGVLMRHFPSLLSPSSQLSTLNSQPPIQLPFADELRFVHYRHGRKWAGWAVFRALMTRYTTLPIAFRAWRSVMTTPRPPEPPSFRPISVQGSRPKVQDSELALPGTPHSALPVPRLAGSQSRVTVLIPTVDRYPYLRTLLDQLRRQTIPPYEVIVVDQTSPYRRDRAVAIEFADLPLKWIWLAQAGQCSSRNDGLAASSGDFLLLLDDDVEVPPDLIEAHLNNLSRFGAAASCGVAEEVGSGPLNTEARAIRASDVFPAGNTMITQSALEQTGLFDLAYENGARADGDLGTRFYLSGALVVLNGQIQVLHHHAPSGGLRKHNARTITQTSSRSRLTHRNLPSLTEMYLAQRYYSQRQIEEASWLRVLSTFSIRGGWLRKALKCVISAFALPHTVYIMRRNQKLAKAMLISFPKIPHLPKSCPAEQRPVNSPHPNLTSIQCSN